MITCTTIALGLHLATAHFHHVRDRTYQERNLGVSVACDDWRVGAYRNSFDRDTVYAARDVALPRGWSVSLGVASGYPRAPVVPLATINTPAVYGFRLSVFPALKGSSGGVHLAYEYRLR